MFYDFDNSFLHSGIPLSSKLIVLIFKSVQILAQEKSTNLITKWNSSILNYVGQIHANNFVKKELG